MKQYYWTEAHVYQWNNLANISKLSSFQTTHLCLCKNVRVLFYFVQMALTGKEGKGKRSKFCKIVVSCFETRASFIGSQLVISPVFQAFESLEKCFRRPAYRWWPQKVLSCNVDLMKFTDYSFPHPLVLSSSTKHPIQQLELSVPVPTSTSFASHEISSQSYFQKLHLINRNIIFNFSIKMYLCLRFVFVVLSLATRRLEFIHEILRINHANYSV